jgi:hypothetical protein
MGGSDPFGTRHVACPLSERGLRMMRTAIVTALVVVCVSLAAGPATAHEARAATGLAGPGGPDRHPGHDTVWSQGPDAGLMGVASQHAADYPFYVETAADFFALNDAEVNHLHWWGSWSPPARDGRPVPSVRRVEWNGPGSRALVCDDALWVGCNVAVSGDNTGGPNHVDYYSCSGWLEDGPEVVYELTLPRDATLAVSLYDMTVDLDVFLLSACSENTCITYGDFGFAVELEAGEYYLVVDGFLGAEGSFSMHLECSDVPPLYFVARFYEHSVDVPGDMLYEHYFSDYTEVWNPDLSVFEYWADIPPFPIVDGNFYWISIQSVLSWSAHGQWFWQETDSHLLEWGVMDADIFGAPRWTTLLDAIGRTADLSFELAEIDTPVEDRSWGAIKALYR